MAQPEWITQPGDLGVYPAAQDISLQLVAKAILPASNIRYTLQSGSFPTGDPVDFFLTPEGLLTGSAKVVLTETRYDFTIRATDELGEIRDRSFFVTISGIVKPKFTTHEGVILNVMDSTWVSYQLDYTNPLNETLDIRVTAGSLPLGLEINSTGLIQGYPAPPFNGRIPEIKTYKFVLSIISSLGTTNASYSITIRNQQLTHPQNSRIPVILNSNPQTIEISKIDPLYDYYLINTQNTIYVESGASINFKIIGKDFDNGAVNYEFNDLPLGLTGDSKTGWITGVPVLNAKGLSSYNFSVRVAKATNLSILSKFYFYTISVTREVNRNITWLSDANLATMENGSISNLQIKAEASLPLLYRVVSGSLPPNLKLLESGEIIGRSAQQPTSKLLTIGEQTAFTFEVEAFNPQFVLLSDKKSFTIIIEQVYNETLENIYIKAFPSLPQRQLVNDLLTDTTIIPDEMLYRPLDPYFGKAESVSFVHIYGVPASTNEMYVEAMSKNHYTTSVVLGPIKTAIARDSLGNVEYEIVYSEIIDESVGVNPSVFWPTKIPLDDYDWISASTRHHVSDSTEINKSPSSTRSVYPVSLDTMRQRLALTLGQNLANNLLPKWMTSQQLDGNIIGYIPAWVICYTLPGESATIKSNIEAWSHKLNEVDFTVDRYIIDKSATYNWNAYLGTPAWTELPSGYPAPDPVNQKDIVVLFPRKTILPR